MPRITGGEIYKATYQTVGDKTPYSVVSHATLSLLLNMAVSVASLTVQEF
jgi:hypothetical protein